MAQVAGPRPLLICPSRLGNRFKVTTGKMFPIFEANNDLYKKLPPHPNSSTFQIKHPSEEREPRKNIS